MRVVDVICIADDVANIAEDIFESISLTTTGEFVGEREEEEDSPLEEEAFGRASKEDCGDDVAVEVVGDVDVVDVSSPSSITNRSFGVSIAGFLAPLANAELSKDDVPSN